MSIQTQASSKTFDSGGNQSNISTSSSITTTSSVSTYQPTASNSYVDAKSNITDEVDLSEYVQTSKTGTTSSSSGQATIITEVDDPTIAKKGCRNRRRN